MPTVALARQAMGTRFEIVLHGRDEVALRAAGEEALREIERLEAVLSIYKSSSQISHLNARAAHQPVRVQPQIFHFLQHIAQLHRETTGAFDITIGPLMRCWGFHGSAHRTPTEEALAHARTLTGMHLVQFHPENYTIGFAREGVTLDLGAVGKGYAVEQAVELLREAGVEHALIHGGTSTAYAFGQQPDGRPWTIGIDTPPSDQPASVLAAVPLRDEALSMSAVWGRTVQSNDRSFGHILDPRTGKPTDQTTLAVVVTGSATEADALSTALLVQGMAGIDRISSLRPNLRCLVSSPTGTQARGIELR